MFMLMKWLATVLVTVLSFSRISVFEESNQFPPSEGQTSQTKTGILGHLQQYEASIIIHSRTSDESSMVGSSEAKESELLSAVEKDKGLEFQQIDDQFWQRSLLWFQGRRVGSQTILFQRITVDVPRPQLWRQSYEHSRDMLHKGGDVPIDYARVWYGERIPEHDEDIVMNEHSSGAIAMFVMDSKGEVYGSLSDGVDSYTISSKVDDNGEWNFLYSVEDISDLPDEGDPKDNEDSSVPPIPYSRSLQYDSYLRGKSTPGDRILQQSAIPPPTVTPNQRGVVDVAVIYTTEAKNAEGGDGEIHNLIGLSVFQTNVAFANSGSDIRIRLVQTIEDTSFPDDGSLDAWQAVLTEEDGYFDYWEQVQNETGADSLMFIVNRYPRFCGRSQTGGPRALVTKGCSAKAGRFSFAHELGHWFSAGHDSTSDAEFDNRGYIDQVNCFRTLMAYQNCQNCSSCPRVLYYSNNQTTYEGLPVGKTGRENNLRTMEENYLYVQNLVPSISSTLPIELCREDPCEEAPFMISDNYNGTGRSAFVPGDNVVSSLSIPAGLSIEVFDESNFEGLRRFFGHPETNSSISLKDYDMDNLIGSFIIRPIPIPSEEAVTLCSSFACFGGTKSAVSVGSYRTMPEDIGEDSLARIILPFGWKAEIFEEQGFGGESIEFINDGSLDSRTTSTTGRPRPANSVLSIMFRNRYRDWNNRVRSMIIGLV